MGDTMPAEEQVIEQQEQIQATETEQPLEATDQTDESAQPAEQVDDNQPADTEKPKDDDSDESEEHKRPGGWQKRVNNLTWRNRQLQREMEHMKARLNEVAPQDENDQRNANQPDPEQVVRNIEWQQKKDAFAKSVPDWDKAVESAQYLPKTPELEAAILDSDHGPALFYELAKNPRKAVEMTYMSPTELAREIGRMEARIEMRQPSKVQQQQPKPRPSSAPPPIKPVQPNGGVQPKKDLYSVDDPHEYYRMRYGKK
jgi:hypothetical protein